MASAPPPAAAAAASSVAERLRDRSSTRLATLEALEVHAVPIPHDAALEAAPALIELVALDAAEVPHELFDRVFLLLWRLVEEAVHRGAEAHAAVVGAAWGGGRLERLLKACSEGNVIAVSLRKPAAELTRTDARSLACWQTMYGSAVSRGFTAPLKAAGFATTMEYMGMVRAASRRASSHLCVPSPAQLAEHPCTLIARAVHEHRPGLPEEYAER